MPNPYAAGGMVTDPQMFFGREDIIRTVTTRFAKMQSTSIVGQRRIGKSSLLYHLARHAQLPQGRSLLLAYVDLQDARFRTGDGFFTNALAALDLQTGNTFNFGTVTTAAGFADAIDRLNEAGISPVLLLDEFEELAQRADQFGDDFFEPLRSIGQAGRIAYITASQNSLEALTHQGNLTSPFYNIFSQENLGLLEREAARRLIREPMEREGLRPDTAAVDLVSELAGRHPFYIQIACECVFDALERDSLNPDGVRHKFAGQAEAHFAGLWRHLDDAERAALRWITGDVALAPSSNVLQSLERKGVLDRQDQAWLIFSQALALAVHEERLPAQVPGAPRAPQPVPPTSLEHVPATTSTPPLYAYALVALVGLALSAFIASFMPADRSWLAFVLFATVLLFALVGAGKLGGPDFVKWLGSVLRLWK